MNYAELTGRYFNIEDVWVTQRSLKRIEQVPEIVKKLKDAANCTLYWAGVPVVQLLSVGDRLIVNDGHHRLFSLYMAGRRCICYIDSQQDVSICEVNSSRKPLKKFGDWWEEQAYQLHMVSDNSHLEATCSYYRKYKGTKVPKCHNGAGCQYCWSVYRDNRAKRKGSEVAHS